MSRHSNDPVLDAALQEDAEKLRAMGADPGGEYEDFFDDEEDLDCCHECGQEMLPHEGGCPDDMCAGKCDDCCIHGPWLP